MLKKHQANFTRRRLRNSLLCLTTIVLIAIAVYSMNQSLRHSSFLTGYLLMASFLVLTALGMRKRLSFIPQLGSAGFWVQLHIYVGLTAFALFGFHIGWHVPNGIFEITLALLFLIVGGSGIYGLAITRIYPKRLTSLGGEVIFERIPVIRSEIASEARSLVLESSQSTDVIGKFYVNHLAAFLEKPRSWAYWLMPNGRLKRQLVADIGDLDRYLASDQRQISRQLCQIVEQRDQLDYHHALQSRLKAWLFVHIGFTYSLLLFSIFHMILAHAFTGSMR